MNRDSVLTDLQYAISQLREHPDRRCWDKYDRLQRALDALDRVDDAIQTDITDHPDPTPEDFPAHAGLSARLYMESDTYGREYFGPYDSEDELLAGASRLRRDATAQTKADGIIREVGIVYDEEVIDEEDEVEQLRRDPGKE